MSSYDETKDDLLKRLRRIEGQVRGIQRMIDEDKYCVDVLVQIAAVRAALYKTGFNILQHHTQGCVMNAIKDEDQASEEVIEELLEVIFRFTK